MRIQFVDRALRQECVKNESPLHIHRLSSLRGYTFMYAEEIVMFANSGVMR
ncbi:hypothetical protein X777_08929 [Ooceraea biroi]|uniref:Uncharacterized protein n=1 Tax=Ooceraea biroi TaxID=2015173 RepID=A0A026WB50_OOCBI|nr:hypothetical protein X777_08929 [Ooceraea biroi]